MSDSPRLPVTFVQRLIPPLFLSPPSGMDPRLAQTLAQADRTLADMWSAAAGMVQERPGPPPRAAFVQVGDDRGLIVVMPPPARSSEAYFVASIPNGGKWSCYAWERAAFGDPMMIRAEIDRRHNLGEMSGEPELLIFCAHLRRLTGKSITVIAGPSATRGGGGRVVAGVLIVLFGAGVLAALWAQM
ncbi:MAG: hypothetical protein AAFV53_09305 [Myxococcota bacterium]